MQDDKFNNILKDRAKEFVLLPNVKAFDVILANRKKAKRKRKAIFALVFIFLVGLSSTIFLVNIQNINSNNFKQTTKLESKPNLVEVPIITNKVTKNSDDEIIVEQSGMKNNNLIVNTLKGEKLVDGISNTNQTISNKTNTLIPNKEVSLIKGSALLNDYKLQEVKNASLYLDSFSVAKQVIDSNKNEDSILVDKIIVVNEIKDSLQNGINVKALSANQNNYQTKEPIYFSLSIFNHYMLLNTAYNGANNDFINSTFGLHYNEQAKQSYSLGFIMGFTRKKLSLKVGIAYNNVQFDKLYDRSGSLGIVSNIKKEALVNDYGYNINVIDQSLSFIEMPILLAYTIGSKKINYTLETGFAFQYLIQTNTYLLTSDANEFSYTSQNHVGNNRFNHFQLAGQASFLVNYNLSKHFSIYIGPIAKLHVNQYYKQEFTNRSAPIYIGINSGMNFKF